MNPQARIDHLVVAAASLDEGVRWCEATLGVTPGPGGEHPLMGTHNRLLRIATVDFPRAYLEIIAVTPTVPKSRPAHQRRWFDLDDAALQRTLADAGPRLVHVVANVPDVRAACAALAARGIDRGSVLEASRMTPHGPLQWLITVRDDGARLFDGCLPTLIQWGDAHPATHMPDSGLRLQGLVLTHPDATALRAACDAVGLAQVSVQEGPAGLAATLHTPRGTVVLAS